MTNTEAERQFLAAIARDMKARAQEHGLALDDSGIGRLQSRIADVLASQHVQEVAQVRPLGATPDENVLTERGWTES